MTEDGISAENYQNPKQKSMATLAETHGME
jgi:hypothetical protein